ncbi:hypothetical protein I4U23_031407 [Adineta vaga]|nr:hypothetical protein I4U23_031407 [Adineta vaga]
MSIEPHWTITHGHANRTGWSCRECRSVIDQGESIVIRDGRKLRLMYHKHCYSGGSDPRTQTSSSYYDQKWTNAQSIQEKAPPVKGYGKWRFDRIPGDGIALESVGSTDPIGSY